MDGTASKCMKCAVGGTFSYLHEGHKKMLAHALKFGSIVVGVTSDKFAAKLGKKYAPSFEERGNTLEKYLKKIAKGKFEIVKLDEFAGPAAKDAKITHIAFGEEKRGAAERVNKIRGRKGLAQLAFVSVHHFYGEDYKKISSGAIACGKINAKGKRLLPIVVAVGSKNRTKIEGAKRALRRIFPGRKSKVFSVAASSKVPEQPFGHQTIKGAINRAKEAYAKTKGADYGVGFESGLFEFDGKLFDIAFCALFDGEDYTLGNSMGFALPAVVEKQLREGKGEMGHIVAKIAGIEGLGSKKGAIHFLSDGVLHRNEMNEQALACAFIPRIAKRKGII